MTGTGHGEDEKGVVFGSTNENLGRPGMRKHRYTRARTDRD
jgi:hypothetical protein